MSKPLKTRPRKTAPRNAAIDNLQQQTKMMEERLNRLRQTMAQEKDKRADGSLIAAGSTSSRKSSRGSDRSRKGTDGLSDRRFPDLHTKRQPQENVEIPVIEASTNDENWHSIAQPSKYSYQGGPSYEAARAAGKNAVRNTLCLCLYIDFNAYSTRCC